VIGGPCRVGVHGIEDRDPLAWENYAGKGPSRRITSAIPRSAYESVDSGPVWD
jgi:hypothetical protein